MGIVTQNLPQADAQSMAYSQALCAHIKELIKAAGGKISFAEFMRLALYAPGLGYYSAGSHKIGSMGDFTTAPEISSLFSYCIAEQCAEILAELEQGDILEFGAGTGKMAADILLHLEKLGALPECYYILEISADLKERQKNTLRTKIPHLYDKVVWLEALPQAEIQGVIIANEVLDAMPVEQFIQTEEAIQQRFVALKNDGFVFENGRIESEEIQSNIENIQKEGITFAKDYISELNMNIQPWLKSVADCLKKGVVLLIDYGYARKEFYHSQRHKGTLQCYYQHRVHDDPFLLVGLQDITAHVDFTAVAEAAVAANFSVLGFTSQAMFLLANKLLKMIPQDDIDETQRFNYNQQVKQLTLPNEMGEQFKVIALGKQYDKNLRGFSMQDRLHLL